MNKISSSHCRKFLHTLVGVTSVLIGLSPSIQAQQWTGTVSQYWNLAANWATNTVPNSSQIALFDSLPTHPTLSLGSNLTLDGIRFGSDATQGINIGTLNDFTLTLDGGAGTDIQIDSGSGAHTIHSKVVVTGTQTWINNSSNAFTLAGDINMGTGTVTFNSGGSGGWVLGSANSQLTNTNSGDLTLTVNNSAADVDLTINGRINITNSGTNRTLRLNATTGSVVDINAVIYNNDGAASGGGAFYIYGGGTVNINATKAYTNTTTINQNTTVNVNAVINNGGIWDIDGGTLNWNVTNTSMGTLYFGGGPVNSNSYLNIAEGVTMNLAGNVVAESSVAHSGNSYMNGGTLNLNGNRTFEIRDSNNADEELIVTTTIANGSTASGLTKSRHGTLTLAGNNTYTGNTTLNEGAIILDFRTNNGNKISSTGTLSVGGGQIWLKGNASADSYQSVTQTTISGTGSTQFKITASEGYKTTLSLGTITRGDTSGGMVNFHLSGDNAEILTTNTNTLGILGSWATTTITSGDYFTTVVGGKIQALHTEHYSNLNSQFENQVGKWQVGTNVSSEDGILGSSNQLDVNTLRIAGSNALELADVLRVRTGGLLVDANSSAEGIYGGIITLANTSNNYEFKIQQNSSQSFEISSSFRRYENSSSGHVDITKSGAGEVILSGYNFTGNRSSNSNNGTIRVAEGTLSVKGGNAISDNSSVIIDHRVGANLKLLDNETIGNLSGGGVDGGRVVLGNYTLISQQISSQTFNGGFEGSGTFIKQALTPGTDPKYLILSTTSQTLFTGHIIANNGQIQLGGGSVNNLVNVSTITLNKSGSLLVDSNGLSTLGNKINNSAVIYLNSANGVMDGEVAFRGLAMRSDQTSSREEIFGELALNSGASYATIESSNSSSGNVTTLTATTLTRTNQSTIAVRGTNLGAESGRTGQLRIATANENAFRTTHMTGGNGAAGSSTMSIVRWAIAQDLGANILQATSGTTLTNLQLGNSLATYVNGSGFRALNLSTEYTTLSSATSNSNVRESLTSDLTGVSSKSINALVVNNSSTAARQLTGAGSGTSLHLQSGTMLFTALQSGNNNALPTLSDSNIASGATAQSITLGGFDNGITTGSGEYVIFQNNLAENGVTISSNLTSTATLTKSGLGTLILSGNNSALTDVALNEGTVQISNLNNLGGSDGKLIFAGGTLKLGSGFSGDLSSKEIIIMGETHQAGNNGGRMGTLDTNNINVTFSNNIKGNGEFVKTGRGTLTLSATTATTHKGNFVVEHTRSGSQNGAVAQLVLNNSGGNAIGGNLQIGSYILPTEIGSAAVELARNEQIADDAVISFNAGTDRNAYFNLNGHTETVAGIVDKSGAGMVQVEQNGDVADNSDLILAGSGDYYFSGQLRDSSNGLGGKLNVKHTGSGRQTFSGNNIKYTGTTLNEAGTLSYRHTTAFNGNIENHAILEFEQTTSSAWNYSGQISGSGHFLKTGTGSGTTRLDGVHSMTGSFTVRNGELSLGASGKIDSASGIDVHADASFKVNSAYTFYGKLSGTGTYVGNFTLSKKAGDASSSAELRPGAATQAFNSTVAGNLLGNLRVNGNLSLSGGSSVGDNTGARAILQVSAATLNDASGISAAIGQGNLSTYLNQKATESWNAASIIDDETGVTKHDSVTLTGGLTWEKGSTIRVESVDDYQPTYGDVIDLFDWAPLLAGTAELGDSDLEREGGFIGDLDLPVLGSDLLYNLSAFASHGIIVIVPEPSRMLLLAAALACLTLHRRRKIN